VGDALKYVKLNRTFDILFGLKSDQPLEVGIIWLVLFIMLAAVFSDIFGTFIAISKTTAYIMGIGFAFIIASTRALFKFSIAIFGAIGYVGVLSVAIVILTALAAFVFIHLAIGKWAIKWATKRQIAIEAIREAKQPAEAWKKLKEFEELTKS
jgi:hypothetical protein